MFSTPKFGGISTIQMIALALVTFFATSSSPTQTFKAAVYELESVRPVECMQSLCMREAALKHMMKNVQPIREQSKEAAKQGAEIIVFPESGIVGQLVDIEHVGPFAEQDLSSVPSDQQRDLCAMSGKEIKRMEIQHELSCIAKEAGIYVVANIVTFVVDEGKSTSCSSAWKYYNTNVMYNKEGELVAVYHKSHLYYAENHVFEKPAVPSVVTINTSFGKLGLMTCADIAFAEPSLSLLKNGVNTIIFPTYWHNFPPLDYGFLWHSAWAYVNGVNFLSAQTQYMAIGSTGSGIYSSDGFKKLYYRIANQNESKLVIADIPVVPQSKASIEFGKFANTSKTPVTPGSFTVCGGTYDYQAVVLESKGTARVCQGDFCCELLYKKSDLLTNETYVLAVNSGFEPERARFYSEKCVVTRCPSSDPSSCLQPVSSGNQLFSYFELSGTFTSNYVYPSVLLDGSKRMHVAYDSVVMEQDGRLTYKWKPGDEGVLLVNMIGRPYYKDHFYLQKQSKCT